MNFLIKPIGHAIPDQNMNDARTSRSSNTRALVGHCSRKWKPLVLAFSSAAWSTCYQTDWNVVCIHKFVLSENVPISRYRVSPNAKSFSWLTDAYPL
ncbi:hypothetical protein X777_06751 [Ooceraea biroi]|uniref:Uncharacterized protein n=1 Tax=Ooceraea biroi TaxID=2015173 RepID=A0A026X188_OOCBI|nr:hypothetical protein X777_06751 [Ooceraea biroi]